LEYKVKERNTKISTTKTKNESTSSISIPHGENDDDLVAFLPPSNSSNNDDDLDE
jgi:hypothetical protein